MCGEYYKEQLRINQSCYLRPSTEYTRLKKNKKKATDPLSEPLDRNHLTQT